MIIAVASGKGGTGKTTVAVNMASSISEYGIETSYIDCDVEEPNGHIFLKPHIDESKKVTVPYPVIDVNKCISCGKCAEICQYKAVIILNNHPLVFKDMCHACGGCLLVCPAGAVSESQRDMGILETGRSGKIFFAHGRLNIGQAMSPPLIRDVKKRIPSEGVSVVDCPPGTSCPVIESVKGADYVILVTEPTPFGLNDLQLAVEVIVKLKIPFGVFINRDDIGTNDTLQYCRRRHITIVGSIPNDRKIAELYSSGNLISGNLPEYKKTFSNLIDTVFKSVGKPFKTSKSNNDKKTGGNISG